MCSNRTNNKGVCNMIRTHQRFHSLSFMYLPQRACSFTFIYAKLPNYIQLIKHITQRTFSTLIQRWNFDARRKSIEKCKNILTVVKKALKFQQSLKFRGWIRRRYFNVFYLASKECWKFDVEICWNKLTWPFTETVKRL